MKPDSVFCSRTCRIASIKEEGMELPKALALMNCRDLVKMIEVSRGDRVQLTCSVE
jgi:UV DNA damage endonuclease